MIIYLDQNKWIELSRMVHGKDDEYVKFYAIYADTAQSGLREKTS